MGRRQGKGDFHGGGERLSAKATVGLRRLRQTSASPIVPKSQPR
jgi:hypothetical protein